MCDSALVCLTLTPQNAENVWNRVLGDVDAVALETEIVK